MYAKDYHDLGTPAANGESVTLDIDGATVTVPAGTSIMRAAALADHDIPKLCATDTLKQFGSCRVCLVEIEGRKGFPASCTTEDMSSTHPDLVPFVAKRADPDHATEFSCSLCGARFTHGTLVCGSCPLNAGCEVVKCPSCGFQSPRRSRIVSAVQRLFRAGGRG